MHALSGSRPRLRTRSALALGLLVLASLLVSPREAGAATLVAAPSSAPPGGLVRVTGEGYPVLAMGTLDVEGGSSRRLRINRSASVNVSVRLPPDAVGTVRITATFGEVVASTEVRVLAPDSPPTDPPPTDPPPTDPPPTDPPPTDPPPTAPADALARRARADLRQFTDWLARTGARGYIGEVGWPGDEGRWNDVARAWYADAERAGLWVTNWATGEWWGADYPLSSYHAPDALRVRVANPQAEVIESQTAWWLRGVNVNGGEFGAVSGNPPGSPHTHRFSNADPGVYDRSHHYDTQATFDYLAARGIRLVRLPFRWERIQPRLGGALDGAELQRLTAAVDRAGAAGIAVVLDLHNYGAYYLHDGRIGVRRTIGSPELPHAAFADVWARLSDAFGRNPHVVGYGLMNEPVATASGAHGWEQATQEAVDAIRARGDGTVVTVPGYNWSTVIHFATQHPGGPWIRDPLDRVRYEAHQYFDRDNSGSYANGYHAEVLDAQRRGY